MGNLTLKFLEEQNESMQSQINEQALRIDNLTRIVRDNVKIKYGSVKQKDAKGNVEHVSFEEACDQIKP